MHRLITPKHQLGLERDSTVICTPVSRADERTLAGVRSVIECSDRSVPIVLAGSAEQIERMTTSLLADGVRGGVLLGLSLEHGGEAAAVNEAVRVSLPADLAVVAPGVIVTPGWLERLRLAATSDSTIASATPLSIGSGGVELLTDERNSHIGLSEFFDSAKIGPVNSVQSARDAVDRAAPHILASTLRLRPRIATMGPGCVYIRRAAWDLAGPLEEDAELDCALSRMASRTTALGMVHVAADDVLVANIPVDRDRMDGRWWWPPPKPGYTKASLAYGCAEAPIQETIVCDEHGPLRRSLDRARTALRKLSVTIDGRALTATVGGTQTYIIELILALAREQVATVRVLVGPDISPRAANALAMVPEVELLPYDAALRDPPLTDVVHRPQQVFTPDDLTLLRLVGRRIVVGQQDLIAYHNYAYHADVDAWRAYRRTTRLAMAGADQVVFFSEHARRDVLAEDLLPERRAHVVGIGVEQFGPAGSIVDPPAGLSAGDRFLLCLGADYAHKNRPFAIELLGALRELGWPGRLVLAGAHVQYGSSRARESELLAGDPDLAGAVTDLGAVDEQSRRWLYAHADALVYPTLYEGFGLIPVEAAHAGLPCLFAAQASLTEVAPDAATLIPWDARASALVVLPLLDRGPERESHLKRLSNLSIPGWDKVARGLLAVYEHALAAPPSEAAPRIWQELDRESYIVGLDRDIASLKTTAQEYQDAYHAFEERVGIGLPLIERGGLLSLNQQRGLMRIAARGRLGSAVLAPLDLLGRAE